MIGVFQSTTPETLHSFDNMTPLQENYLPLVDTHAHINLEDFQDDRESLIARSLQGRLPQIKGRQIEDALLKPFMAAMVVPSVDVETAKVALTLAEQYDYIYAALAIHPNHLDNNAPQLWRDMKELIESEYADHKTSRMVALGETGLDRYWDDAPFENQKKYFQETIELADKLELPIIIHSRDANNDLEGILTDCYQSKRQVDEQGRERAFGVVHSFSGTPEQAERLVELGFYLGFGGMCTYTSKRFENIWQAARVVPVERILLETDAPFLTPAPWRGKIERNEPLAVAYVAKRLAELRNTTVREIATETTKNAQRLFRLPGLPSKPVETDANSRG
ncbi:MAG: TatD family hydrolase [Planctomycetia bacterium]|nr:TatD family hydrolase [Planctomycetia bacterium]